MEISPYQIRWILIAVFVLVISVAVHEFGHAIMADKLGDDTPRRQGRVTLNPIAHIDPIGTLLLPIIGGVMSALSGGVGGFGWGKPVQWSPRNIRRGMSMSTASVLVSVAGPGMNLVLGTVLALVNAVLVARHVVPAGSEADEILHYATNTNFVLMFFNLLPLPPLDGGHVAESLVPYRHRETFTTFARFAPFVILLVMMNHQIARIFLVPALFCADHIRAAFGHLLGIGF